MIYRCLIFCLVILSSIGQLIAQDQPIIANIELDFSERSRVIGTAGESIIYHDNGNILISDGSPNGTKIIGTLESDQKIKHAKVNLNNKLYFILGKIIGADNDEEVLVEVNPATSSMRELVRSEDEITGLVNYRLRLYFELKDHPTFGQAYISYQPETEEFEHMFDTEGFGVQDAVKHKGLIYLVLQTPRWDGVSLAFSNGGPDIINEIFNIGDDQASGWDVSTNMTSAANNLYFWHRGNGSGFTLYVSDGDPSGTKALKDGFRQTYWENHESTELQDIVVAEDRIFFRGHNGQFGPYLWTSDGTTAGTRELLLNGESIFEPHGFVLLNKELYVSPRSDEAVVVDTDNLNVELAFDIDEVGNEVQDSGHDMVLHNGTLYLSAQSKNSWQFELYKKNQNSKSISKATELNIGGGPIISSSTSAEDNLFFFVLGFGLVPSTLRVYDPTLSHTLESSRKQITPFPNPCNSQLYLKGLKSNTDVTIVDMYGNNAMKVLLDEQQLINTSELPEGIYYVFASDSRDRYITSFIKI